MTSTATPTEQADLAIVGAGPAGLMAAITAAERGRKVVLIEQLPRLGRKLLATGGGRCNLTNTLSRADLATRFGRHGRFMMPALELLDSRALRAFFDALAVPTHAPDGLHVFPASDSAATVLHALDTRARHLGVVIRPGVRVTGLWLNESKSAPDDPSLAPGEYTGGDHAAGPIAQSPQGPPCIHGGLMNAMPGSEVGASVVHSALRTPHSALLLGLLTDGGPVSAPHVILATGGRGYPDLGAGGAGYALAREAGHTIVDPTPALVPLVTQQTDFVPCAGVSVPQVRLWIDLPRQPRAGLRGDLLFTHRGISGPAVLDISGDVGRLLASRPTVPIRIDLTPSVNQETWLRRFDRWQDRGGATTVCTLLAAKQSREADGGGLVSEEEWRLPKSLAAALVAMAGIDPIVRPSQVPRSARQRLAEILTGLPLTITATEGWDAAMVTRGGVSLKEVDPHTLESRLLRGLFFAGELLDLDGPSGGFNLQWAFSSGRLAGQSSST
jgi:hypothetical protein